jgi:hypothetical protein
VCIGHTIYTYTISNYGLPERLSGAFPKSFLAAVFLTAVIATFGMCMYNRICEPLTDSALVYGFFTFRVYVLSKKFYISLIIAVMITLPLLCLSAVSFIGMTMPLFVPKPGFCL